MKIGKYKLEVLHSSLHSLFSGSWSMSKGYKLLYKSLDFMVIFTVGKKILWIKHPSIPYLAIYNKNWKQDKQLCERYYDQTRK